VSGFDLSPYLHAEVFDIQAPLSGIEGKMLVDTNILLFCYYSRWDLLATIDRGAKNYQLREYSSFFRKLLVEKVVLYVHKDAVVEFIHRIFLGELKLLFCEHNNPELLNTFDLKYFVREHWRETIRVKGDLLTYLNQLKKTFRLINCDSRLEDFLGYSWNEWHDSLGGIVDATMVAEAKKLGIDSVLSDDSDFISFSEIKLYTANRMAIAAYKKIKDIKAS
jgi:hypothetical protein